MSEGYAWKQYGHVSMEYGWSGSDTALQLIKIRQHNCHKRKIELVRGYWVLENSVEISGSLIGVLCLEEKLVTSRDSVKTELGHQILKNETITTVLSRIRGLECQNSSQNHPKELEWTQGNLKSTRKEKNSGYSAQIRNLEFLSGQWRTRFRWFFRNFVSETGFGPWYWVSLSKNVYFRPSRVVSDHSGHSPIRSEPGRVRKRLKSNPNSDRKQQCGTIYW